MADENENDWFICEKYISCESLTYRTTHANGLLRASINNLTNRRHKIPHLLIEYRFDILIILETAVHYPQQITGGGHSQHLGGFCFGADRWLRQGGCECVGGVGGLLWFG